jgi:hypothetical protein
VGLRQAMNENPAITTGVTIGVIVLAIVFIIWQIAGGGGSGSQAPTNLKWFSDDDGKTAFADDASNIPPYTDKHGKTAYIAIVYQCGDGKPFVNRLQRFNAEGKKKAEEQMKTNPNARISMAFSMQFIEFKLPGPGHRWVKMGSPEGAEMTVKCPDGTDNNIQLVEPTEKDRIK